MNKKCPLVYPYIPNSEPKTKSAMLREIGLQGIEDLFSGIPGRLRLKKPLELPKPFLSECELVRHVETILAKNISTRERLNFLGAGCYQHYVPAVCDEINSRSEFLTAYAGEPYEDHGRFQALFEYQSMMGELLNMEVVNVPTYDGFQASATALRMAARITNRNQVILAGAINPDKISKISDYLKPDMYIYKVPFVKETGLIDLEQLNQLITSETACVFFENPSFFGEIEVQAEDIAKMAHQKGALCVVAVDPITLGVINPPVEYGADIVCGDIQSLGIHMYFGGGHGGFIATKDDPKYVMEYPSRLFGIAPTIVDGEYGFGDVAYERTSFAKREGGKEWVGTAAALWGITAGVYLALMGPQGMKELGLGIMQRTRYAMERLSEIEGSRIPFKNFPHFREFVVCFEASGKSVAEINRALLGKGIFGGKDISNESNALRNAAIYCVTEVHSKDDIDFLAESLKEVLK